jgi:hypothetical protein
MYLSKAFVVIIGAITAFLLVSFATEESRCIARARRILDDMTRSAPDDPDLRRPVYRVEFLESPVPAQRPLG